MIFRIFKDQKETFIEHHVPGTLVGTLQWVVTFQSYNSPGGKVLLLSFTDKETKVQKDEAPCPGDKWQDKIQSPFQLATWLSS